MLPLVGMPVDDAGKTSDVSSTILCNHLLDSKTVSRAHLLRTRDGKSFTERQLCMIEEMSPVFDQFNLNDSDLLLIHLSFRNICTPFSGMICIEELALLLKLESTSFNQRVLGTLDAGKTGKLDFFEFLIVAWIYCTSDSDNLGKSSDLLSLCSVAS